MPDIRDEDAALGVKKLVLAGFMTHMCVSSTARAALDLGFQTTVPADASATRDLIAQDVSRAKRADRIDSHAAAVILQAALDALSGGLF